MTTVGSTAQISAVAGGITAPLGFTATGVACGIKARGLDLALVVSEGLASAAGLFTTNLAVAAPVTGDSRKVASDVRSRR